MEQHIRESELERYFLHGVNSTKRIAEIEEHLLWCDPCIKLAQNTGDFVHTIKRIIRLYQKASTEVPPALAVRLL